MSCILVLNTTLMLQAMLAALLYSTAGLAFAAVGALGLMATVAFSSIAFMATIGEAALPAQCL